MATETPTKAPQDKPFIAAFEAGQESERTKFNLSGQIHRLGVHGTPYLLHLDQNSNLQVKDMEGYLDSPSSVEKTIIFSDVPSFIAYVNEFSDEGSKIFGQAEIGSARFRAILDYHKAAIEAAPAPEGVEQAAPRPLTPRWGRHVAEYAFPITPEWKELLEKNKKKLKQLEFAELVERLKLNFIFPNGATMLELARTLEARTEGQFKSSYNTDNGDRVLLFTQTIDASAGRSEKIPIPNQLSLYVQPFIRGETYQIEAIFRYRVEGGAVTFEYELIKPHEFIDKAVEQVRSMIEIETLIKPLFGNA